MSKNQTNDGQNITIDRNKFYAIYYANVVGIILKREQQYDCSLPDFKIVEFDEHRMGVYREIYDVLKPIYEHNRNLEPSEWDFTKYKDNLIKLGDVIHNFSTKYEFINDKLITTYGEEFSLWRDGIIM